LISNLAGAGSRGRTEQARVDAEKMKEDRYQSMKDKVVQGTNMTYGDFEAKTGRRFNATNAQDSSLISNLAGAGSRGRSETAKQLDLTVDQFNARYDAQNKRLAQKLGDTNRAADEGKFNLDRYKADPEYREKLRQDYMAEVVPGIKAKLEAEEFVRATEEGIRKGKAIEARDKIIKTDLEKSKNSIPSMGYNPRTPKPKPAENFVSSSEPEKPFLPTPTGDDNAANAAARSEVRNIERYRATQTPTVSTKKPNEYVSLINSFTAPKVSRKPIVPGSKQDVDRQLKGLRGQ